MDLICHSTSIPDTKQLVFYLDDNMKLSFDYTNRNYDSKKNARFLLPTFVDVCNLGKMSVAEPASFRKSRNHRAQLRSPFYNFGKFYSRSSWVFSLRSNSSKDMCLATIFIVVSVAFFIKLSRIFPTPFLCKDLNSSSTSRKIPFTPGSRLVMLSFTPLIKMAFVKLCFGELLSIILSHTLP